MLYCEAFLLVAALICDIRLRFPRRSLIGGTGYATPFPIGRRFTNVVAEFLERKKEEKMQNKK